MPVLNKKNIPILLIFAIGFIIIPFIGLYKSRNIENRGVYTLAKVYNISSAGKEGLTYKAYYLYKLKKYTLHFSQASFFGLKMNDVILIKIDTVKPDLYKLSEFKRVPSNITINDVPKNGWKVLPQF